MLDSTLEPLTSFKSLAKVVSDAKKDAPVVNFWAQITKILEDHNKVKDRQAKPAGPAK